MRHSLVIPVLDHAVELDRCLIAVDLRSSFRRKSSWSVMDRAAIRSRRPTAWGDRPARTRTEYRVSRLARQRRRSGRTDLAVDADSTPWSDRVARVLANFEANRSPATLRRNSRDRTRSISRPR